MVRTSIAQNSKIGLLQRNGCPIAKVLSFLIVLELYECYTNLRYNIVYNPQVVISLSWVSVPPAVSRGYSESHANNRRPVRYRRWQ